MGLIIIDYRSEHIPGDKTRQNKTSIAKREGTKYV